MNICIFCSANDLSENYTLPALKAVEDIAHGGHTLIWGGSDTGMMKQVADTAQNAGAQIVGVSVEFLREFARKDANEMIIAIDLTERKATMLKRSDAFLVLPGGIGTLDEVTEILEFKKHHQHTKPIVFLNIDGFYDGLFTQLSRMYSDGFLTRELAELVEFINEPAQVLPALEKVNEI